MTRAGWRHRWRDRWRRGLPLGRLFGFPVALNPSWLPLGALLAVGYGHLVGRSRPGLATPAAYAIGLGLVVLLVLSVLAHELGHAFTCRRYGIGVRGITLELLGGYTEMEREAPTPWTEMAVSLAGPAVSALLGLAGLPGVEVAVSLAGPAVSAVLGGLGVAGVVLTPRHTLAHQVAFQLAATNLIVATFNALPGLPLDGGRALQALVWWRTGDVYLGSRVAGWAGRAVALACAGAALALYANRAVTLIGAVLVLLVALSVAAGAGHAVRYGRLGARLPLLHAAALARPIYPVPAGTPLAEAHRRAAAAGAAGATLAVADAAGAVVALVHPAADAAVPADERTLVPVDAVARGVAAGRVLPAGLRGVDVLRAVQADPDAEYLVASGEDVIGVLRGADVAELLAARETSR